MKPIKKVILSICVVVLTTAIYAQSNGVEEKVEQNILVNIDLNSETTTSQEIIIDENIISLENDNITNGMTTPAVLNIGTEKIDRNIISVDLPENISFILDPYMIYGEEQVISDEIVFTNYSTIPIQIIIKDIMVDIPLESNVVLVQEPVVSNVDSLKEVFLQLEDCDEGSVFNLKEEQINRTIGCINPAGEKKFKISGNANGLNSQWQTKDKVNVVFIFEITGD